MNLINQAEYNIKYSYTDTQLDRISGGEYLLEGSTLDDILKPNVKLSNEKEVNCSPL